jgi:hypothetical protein
MYVCAGVLRTEMLRACLHFLVFLLINYFIENFLFLCGDVIRSFSFHVYVSDCAALRTKQGDQMTF